MTHAQAGKPDAPRISRKHNRHSRLLAMLRLDAEKARHLEPELLDQPDCGAAFLDEHLLRAPLPRQPLYFRFEGRIIYAPSPKVAQIPASVFRRTMSCRPTSHCLGRPLWRYPNSVGSTRLLRSAAARCNALFHSRLISRRLTGWGIVDIERRRCPSRAESEAC